MLDPSPIQKIETQPTTQPTTQPGTQSTNTPVTTETAPTSKVTPFSFVPYIGHCIPEDLQVTYKNTQYRQQISYQKIKRNIIVNQSNVSDNEN
mgnify:FL=1